MNKNNLSEKQAVISLGANLGHAATTLHAALVAMDAWEATERLATSSFYATSPVGYTYQPDFVNAVALVATTLSPWQLLEKMQATEAAFGRERSFKNAPRTLDLDLIDYAGASIHSDQLTLPHPRACERLFVMVPLAEIAPDYCIGKRSALEWQQQLQATFGRTQMIRQLHES